MPEHQQTQKSTESKTTSQRQATPRIQTPVSNPFSIIQRARINPKSLTHADVMQLQRTIGNRAVGRLFSEIGLIPSNANQAPPVQRQEIPEEEEPLQGKMAETIQRQEIPEEEEPLQGKMIETIQRQEIPEEEEPLQGKFENKPEIACPSCFAAPILQRQEIPEEEEPLQGKFESIQRQEIPEEEELLQTKRENNTGMPDNLKAGVESLSGIDMSDVRVHYNSSKPAQVGALAYTQGTNIHVAPGQERHLPHEAWHVVQQAQGRVQPTLQMKDGVPVNDDVRLEREADVMGERAFTSGQDLFFRQGAYEPGSWEGQELIAQELTHVVQQNGEVKIQRLTDKQTGRCFGNMTVFLPNHVIQPKLTSTKTSTPSFLIRNKSDFTINNSELILQRAEDLDPQYCQANDEWYAVHMTDSCFQHFQPVQYQTVINACIQTLANNSSINWTTFSETTLRHDSWTFVCTWVETFNLKYLKVFHADQGYKGHYGKKEEMRKVDQRDRYNQGSDKDPFGGKDPSQMSAEEMSKCLGL